MKLFTSDFFSAPQNSGQSAPISGDHIAELVSNFYPHLGAVQNITPCDGGGINSANLRIETENSIVVAKKKTAPDIKPLERQAVFTNEIAKINDTLFPSLLRNSRKEFLTVDGNDVWILQNFAEGKQFQGSLGELISYCKTLITLRSTLATMKAEDLSEQSLNGKDIAQTLLEDFSTTEALFAITGPLGPEILSQNWNEIVIQACDRVLQADIGRPPTLSPFHIDLHPHNVLCHKNSIAAIVDWESFRQCNAEAFIGFSLIKMGRQSVANGVGFSTVQQQIFAVCDKLELPYTNTLLLGLSELLRRIWNVINVNKMHQDRRWNSFLPLIMRNVGEGLYFIDKKERS
ncbi:phosphotransferase [Kiloniella laminariae]|uniref:phosphotransferase n=1 Tax=Kiloniella laminariae TaxID=454162 RepID=UPI00036F6046|nr:phosphotransferase [Kiloniella laminariae]